MFDLTKSSSSAPELISVKYLIRTIGVLGFLFPIALIAIAVGLQECEVIQNSISAYYHTLSRNLFVGFLSAIALCLFAYKGYSSLDNVLGTVAAVLSLGVAFFPTSVSAPFTLCLPEVIDMGRVGVVHFVSAALLFFLLGCFSLFLFTQSKGTMTREKKKRNTIYKVCGILIFLFIALIAIYVLILKEAFPVFSDFSPVFWLETGSLWAFSLSWLTKGDLLFKDRS